MSDRDSVGALEHRWLPNFRVKSLGVRVYGLAGIVIGLIGLAWGDFASVWQPVESLGTVPHRQALAYLFAAAFLIGGVAVELARTEKIGVLTLTALHAVSALLWVPRIVGFPKNFGTWTGFMEPFSMVAAGIVAFAMLTQHAGASSRLARIACFLYGLCPVSFGIVHFLALPQTAALVPGWIPPSKTFWAVATGVFHLMAGLAILSGVLDRIGARLLTAMMLGFGVLVWLPALFSAPHDHMTQCGNAINLAMAASAWIVADAVTSRRAALR